MRSLCHVLFLFAIQTINVRCIFKQLLKKSPVIGQKDIWSRSFPNIAIYGNMTLSLRRTLKVPTPSYVQVLSERILSVTSFSLLRKGCIMQFDLSNTSQSHSIKGDYLWPNELTIFKDRKDHTIMLIPDGFLLPGQSDGGLYAIRDPHLPHSSPVRITASKNGWFYHRATHVRLPSGQCGILTARACKPLFGAGRGELVWLSVPTSVSEGSEWPSELSASTSTWPEVVLTEGPDVMFEVFDRDPSDDCVDIIAAHFFGREVSVLTLRGIPTAPFVEATTVASLDVVGRPYGICLARMNPPTTAATGMTSQVDDVSSNNDQASLEHGQASSRRRTHQPDPYTTITTSTSTRSSSSRSSSSSCNSGGNHETVLEAVRSISSSPSCVCDNSSPTHVLLSTHECSYDLSSAFQMVWATLSGRYPRVLTGGRGIRAGDRTAVESGVRAAVADRGGGLYAYEIPRVRSASALTVPRFIHQNADVGNDLGCTHVPIPTSSETDREASWPRQTLFRGFKVRGWGGIFSPGAPGFPYVFRMPNKPHAPPLILLAGDCTGSAYLFAPVPPGKTPPSSTSTPSTSTSTSAAGDRGAVGDLPAYHLAFEVECGATVGSAAVSAPLDASGDVEIFIPSYELNQIHVFRLSDDKFH